MEHAIQSLMEARESQASEIAELRSQIMTGFAELRRDLHGVELEVARVNTRLLTGSTVIVFLLTVATGLLTLFR